MPRQKAITHTFTYKGLSLLIDEYGSVEIYESGGPAGGGRYTAWDRIYGRGADPSKIIDALAAELLSIKSNSKFGDLTTQLRELVEKFDLED